MRTLKRKTHDIISGKMLLPLARARRRVGDLRRPVMLAYLDGMKFRRESARWNDAERREWILNRLRLVARRAYRETDYYHRLFDRVRFDPESDFSFDDFASLPVLERDDLRNAGRSIISGRVPAGQLKRDATGGSTGRPTEIWMGPEERGWRESAGDTFLAKLGVPTGTSTALLWGHNLDPVASNSLRDRAYNFVNNIRWFDCFRLSADRLEAYHREFEQWGPACIIAYASALGHLAEFLVEQGIKPTYPTRRLITGAEKLLPQHREIIETVFEVPLHERYGSRDIGYIGYQMDPALALGFEIDWANLLVEPETEAPESSILITKLHADAMPMLRYRIGDVGRFAAGQKPGHPAFALGEIVGRDTERIWLPDGCWIHGVQIPHMMKDFPAREFMLVQHEDYSVDLKVIAGPGFDDSHRAEILSIVSANLPGLRVAVEIVEEIPRTAANKWRPVVSEVNRAFAKTL
jgi:phenylacetate-CoA ligase